MTTIRPAQAADIDAIASLLDEMDRFYGGTSTEPLEDRLAQIDTALFGPTATSRALVAWDEESLVGLVSYSFLWPAAGLTRSLYMKDLYVANSCRSAGVDKILEERFMNELFTIARDNSCCRVEWAADVDDTPALNFYDKLGFKPSTSQLFYRTVL
ncbi:GNAT family N-acetyltransferase [Streptomyces sp. SL13]|jgi:ribosomal protein S18 acetylase RimI-like enzyme|uniref:GNAT family N-acetyltransferase n=1 Tax=Streptantibioticus silvisoli TaxID=2705255 RepID=A0AA90K957_9ACTN|nr:GNAT family N-acetyltransferase [Streptantibioticus silvisoli]MDI5970708.1 GNAT family N-acetyltransferase [Streptantibioticus silvisoli]